MVQKNSDYQAFVVRIWHDEVSGEWRGTLKDTASGKSRSFASLPLMVEQLMIQARGGAQETVDIQTAD